MAKNSSKLVILITGTMTAGKAALKYFLVDKGFKYIRHTDPILQEGLSKKIDMKKRENWIKVLVDMRKRDGNEVLSKLADEKVKDGDRFVICPIRHPEDIKYFKKRYNTIIIFIDAPFDIRYKRTFLKEMGSTLTKEEFKKKDDKENNPNGIYKEYLPNINECRKLADHIINNDSSLNDLNKDLEDFLRSKGITALIDTGAYDDFEM